MASNNFDEEHDDFEEGFQILDHYSLEGFIDPDSVAVAVAVAVSEAGATPPVVTSTETEQVPNKPSPKEEDTDSGLKTVVLANEEKDQLKAETDTFPKVINVSVLNSDSECQEKETTTGVLSVTAAAVTTTTQVSAEETKKDGATLELEKTLTRVTEENVGLKRELETLTSKMEALEAQSTTGKDAFEKIKTEVEYAKKAMNQSSQQVYQLTKENESLKIQIEAAKLRMKELETQLSASCDELAAKKRDAKKFVKKEKMDTQLRFKDDQLDKAKKQLKELDELYKDEQNQTIELKEKLRIAESKPISSPPENSQLFSLNLDDVLSMQAELSTSKATIDGQKTEVEKMRSDLDRQRRLLENSDKERTFLAQITVLLGSLLAVSLFWVSRSTHTQD